MKSCIKTSKIFFVTLLLLAFLISFSMPLLAQSYFSRNDNFDFAGEHYPHAIGVSLDNFSIYISSNSDFPKFKLHFKKNLLDIALSHAFEYRVDMNNDGTWEQGWTDADELTVTFTYPNPPSGLSANYTVKTEIKFSNGIGQITNRTKYTQVTIFPAPRVYVNNEENSFIQIRNENASAKIPVLMIEGFDPLNEKFAETYYNLTWELVNTDLYPNGYEVFILNFQDGGRDLRLNADIVMKAIENIHEICPNYQIVVSGLSMDDQ